MSEWMPCGSGCAPHGSKGRRVMVEMTYWFGDK